MALPTRLPANRKVFTGDRNMDDAQRLAQQAAAKLNAQASTMEAQAKQIVSLQALTAAIAKGTPLVGQLLTSVTLSTSAGSSVPHTLGYVPTGYIVTRVRSQSAAGAFVAADNGAHTSTALNLLARGPSGATFTADIWVF